MPEMTHSEKSAKSKKRQGEKILKNVRKGKEKILPMSLDYENQHIFFSALSLVTILMKSGQ